MAEGHVSNDVQRPGADDRVEVRDPRLEVAVNELPARTENVRQLRFQTLGREERSYSAAVARPLRSQR